MTQLRRTISPELSSLLRSTARLQVADLYTITLSGGTVLRWTNHDQVVTIGAQSWVLGPGITRDLMEFTAGVEANPMVFTLTGSGGTLINGVALIPWVLNGGLDGADVLLEKAFRADLGGAWIGKLEQFSGRVSDVESGGRLQVQVTVRSYLEAFNLPLPPTLYQPQCRNTVFDANCGLNRASHTWVGTASAASNPLRLAFGHSLPQAAGWFDLGAVVFTTGANAGVKRTVRTHTSGQIVAMQPWPAPVAVGDAFEIYRGCDLTLETCKSRYNNALYFRGMPFIPPPETVT